MVHGDLKDYITKMVPSYEQRLHLVSSNVGFLRIGLKFTPHQVRDLTSGLTYLHSQTAPVRHGDLKPVRCIAHQTFLSEIDLAVMVHREMSS